MVFSAKHVRSHHWKKEGQMALEAAGRGWDFCQEECNIIIILPLVNWFKQNACFLY